MSQTSRLAAIPAADVAGYSRLMGADQEVNPVVKDNSGTHHGSCRVIPPRTVITFTMVVVIAIASAAWWAWRFVSLELTAVYAEGFRKAGMPEE